MLQFQKKRFHFWTQIFLKANIKIFKSLFNTNRMIVKVIYTASLNIHFAESECALQYLFLRMNPLNLYKNLWNEDIKLMT